MGSSKHPTSQRHNCPFAKKRPGADGVGVHTAAGPAVHPRRLLALSDGDVMGYPAVHVISHKFQGISYKL